MCNYTYSSFQDFFLGTKFIIGKVPLDDWLKANPCRLSDLDSMRSLLSKLRGELHTTVVGKRYI